MTSIIMHSGGLDSTILANHLKEKGETPRSVYINFGDINKNLELKAFERTASFIDLPMDVIDASSISTAFGSSIIATPDSPAMPNPGQNVMPLGSLLFYGIVLPYAHRCGIEKVYVGLTKLDAEFRPEFTSEFAKKVSDLTENSGFNRIEIDLPFIEFSKTKVLELGSEKLFELSRSCIHTGIDHCGVCSGCRSRKEAFSRSNFADPTTYEH